MSKSRSLHHELSTSDSVSSKVENRNENISLQEDGNKKSASSFPTPTTVYTVSSRDTLTSVAARFDTTPSELTQLNRLTSSFIYPGQQLLVPDKSAKNDTSPETKNLDENKTTTNVKGLILTEPNLTKECTKAEEIDILEGLRPTSPKPGHIKQVLQVKDEKRNQTDDPVITQRFLKINVRHITDGQGVVGGVLLVTPNAIMFDPNVSDPLVIEHGPEYYGVIAPMELVVNIAIFYDIAHMRVADSKLNNDKIEIYYPKTCNQHELKNKDKRDTHSHFKKNENQESTHSNPENEVFSSLTTEKAEESERSEHTENSELSLREVETRDKKPFQEGGKNQLDHHWAVLSKDRSTIEEDELNTVKTEDIVNSEKIHQSNVLIDTIPESQKNASQLSKQLCSDSGASSFNSNILPIKESASIKEIYSNKDIERNSESISSKSTSLTSASGSTSESQKSKLHGDTEVQSVGGTEVASKKKNISFSLEDEEQVESTQDVEKTTSEQNKKKKMLKRLSYPLTWVEGLAGEGSKSLEIDSGPSTGDSSQSVFSKVFSSSPITLVSELGGNLFLSKTSSEETGNVPASSITPNSDGQISPGRSSIATFRRPHLSEGSNYAGKSNKSSHLKLDYRSMVSVDDMPELFVSFDKLIPRPARAPQDPPLYLRLRMGKPIGKSVPLPTSVMSYGKNKLKPEYWFSVPKNRVDELCRFVFTWVPHLYGELDEESIKAKGFELIQHDTEWENKNSYKKKCEISGNEEITRESWEVLSMNTDDFKETSAFTTGSFDLDFTVPDLIGETEILTEEHREKLYRHLPARAEGYSWTLVFSTSQHGFSLNSLYRKMQRIESPILIVIEDINHNVFGALTSCSLHVSDYFYGTGESLLYKFTPEFKVFHWTGENMYFIKGNPESLSIGAGDGKFGLWLDGDLNQGRTQSCKTYANEPLALEEDFVVKTLECWAFI